jgi:transketolase
MDTERLREHCREVRRLIIRSIGNVGVGHLGGSMSLVEALVVLYFRHMRIDPVNPRMEGRDRLVLSKGHAGPALYACLAAKGYFDVSLLDTLNQLGTSLPSHPDMNRTPGVDMTTGSLGQGLSCAVGVAIGSKARADGARIYAVIGDGESNEGLVWEAAMFAAQRRLDNLAVLTDYNKMQIDGETMAINDLEPLADKWRAFGWNVLEVPGHDVEAISNAVGLAKVVAGKPSMIILHTFKGKGVSFLEESWRNNHNVTITPEQVRTAMAELGGNGDA